MRIVDVRAVHPKVSGAPRDWRGSLGQILVAVETDGGLTGYGVGGGGLAGVHIVRTVLRETLLREDASEVEQLWERMYRQMIPFGRTGLTIMALSGVDLALWDLRGKCESKPIAELLGGSVDRPISVYKTVSNIDGAKAAKEQGYNAVKIHVEKIDIPEKTAAKVSQVRDALGPNMQMMIDAFMSWDVPFTLQVAREISQYNIAWLEEPLPPDDLQGYMRLSRECPIPIAGGEHEYTAAVFENLMQQHLYTVFQPDVCWCGGLTQLIKIYEMARRYGVRICPHRGAEVWALHAIAALDPQPLAESGRPWMTWVKGQSQIEKGSVRLGNDAGFGVTFDEALWRNSSL